MDDIEKLEIELDIIIKKFNIPDHRKSCKTIHNYRWLLKNVQTKNSNVKNFDRAMEILKILVKDKK